jgi:hypothetical protein
MKNTTLFLLSLFLLLPAVTQCMKRSFSQIIGSDDNSLQIKQITIQSLKEEYENLRSQLNEISKGKRPYDKKELQHLMGCLYPNIPHHGNCAYFGYTTEGLKYLNVKDKRYQEYSLLGIAIMAHVSFQKSLIKKLLDAECIATEKDKNIALVEKLERCTPSIITRICTFKHFPLLTEIKMPKEINTYIALLMFETEESLL